MQKISLIISALILALDHSTVCSRIRPEDVDYSTMGEQEEPQLTWTFDDSVVEPTPEAQNVPDEEPLEKIDVVAEETSPCNDGSSGCPKDRLESQVDPNDYKKLRIEALKEKILQRLGFKAPPRVTRHLQSLPSLLLSDSEALLQDSVFSESSAEPMSRNLKRRSNFLDDNDFYGTTKNIIIMPDDSTKTQLPCSPRTSVCLTFRLSPEALSGDIVDSHLWLYKHASPLPDQEMPFLFNQTLVVSVLVLDRQFRIIRRKIMALEDDANHKRSNGGWTKLRVDQAVQRWIRKPHLVHALEITCKGCGDFPVPVSQVSDQQPFLVLAEGPRSTQSRKRRNVDCTTTTAHCCKESFYLNFTEIEWDKWIIQPRGYQANYCKGICQNDVSASRYHHTSVMNRYLQSPRARTELTGLSLCCTPSQMSDISLIYVDESDQIFQKSLPNMVVESCDCA